MSSFSGIDPPLGEVSLRDKQSPIHEWEDREAAEQQGLVFTRGNIDISAFKEKLLNLPADMWEDENQEGNVKVKRPSHDAWGIKKIVFTFCDDFIMKVLDLPYSRSEEWKSLLSPIYAAIGVDESRVVRSLLASMPPQMEIPVHHDTGYWVKHAHRIHVRHLFQSIMFNLLIVPIHTFIRFPLLPMMKRWTSLQDRARTSYKNITSKKEA